MTQKDSDSPRPKPPELAFRAISQELIFLYVESRNSTGMLNRPCLLGLVAGGVRWLQEPFEMSFI